MSVIAWADILEDGQARGQPAAPIAALGLAPVDVMADFGVDLGDKALDSDPAFGAIALDAVSPDRRNEEVPRDNEEVAVITVRPECGDMTAGDTSCFRVNGHPAARAVAAPLVFIPPGGSDDPVSVYSEEIEVIVVIVVGPDCGDLGAGLEVSIGVDQDPAVRAIAVYFPPEDSNTTVGIDREEVKMRGIVARSPQSWHRSAGPRAPLLLRQATLCATTPPPW